MFLRDSDLSLRNLFLESDWSRLFGVYLRPSFLSAERRRSCDLPRWLRSCDLYLSYFSGDLRLSEDLVDLSGVFDLRLSGDFSNLSGVLRLSGYLSEDLRLSEELYLSEDLYG